MSCSIPQSKDAQGFKGALGRRCPLKAGGGDETKREACLVWSGDTCRSRGRNEAEEQPVHSEECGEDENEKYMNSFSRAIVWDVRDK